MKTAYPTFIAEHKGCYLVFVPDLEINTEGASFADAMEMARDAIGLMGMSIEDDGGEIPQPSDYSGAMAKAKADADEVFDYSQGVLTLVDVDFAEYRRKHDRRMVRRNVTLPAWLDVEAREAKINVSQVLREALQEKLAIE